MSELNRFREKQSNIVFTNLFLLVTRNLEAELFFFDERKVEDFHIFVVYEILVDKNIA